MKRNWLEDYIEKNDQGTILEKNWLGDYLEKKKPLGDYFEKKMTRDLFWKNSLRDYFEKKWLEGYFEKINLGTILKRIHVLFMVHFCLDKCCFGLMTKKIFCYASGFWESKVVDFLLDQVENGNEHFHSHSRVQTIFNKTTKLSTHCVYIIKLNQSSHHYFYFLSSVINFFPF